MSKSRMLAAVVALGLLAGGAGVLAQQSGTAAPLTEKDRAEIRDLVARYARALGGCQDAEYASLFTPDGTFTSDDFRGTKHRELFGQKGTLKGRTQIAELVRTEEFCMEGKPRTGAPGTNRPAPSVEITSLPITLHKGVQPVPLTFQSDTQMRKLEFSIEPQENEISTANNRFTTEIGIDRTKIRVLYIEGNVTRIQQVQQGAQYVQRGSFSDLQEALSEDPDIECVVLFDRSRRAGASGAGTAGADQGPDPAAPG